MPPVMAIEKAADVGLDLVEVSPETNPPVCRILDYGKFKYMEKKRKAEAKKKQSNTTVKEVKFRPKIETHDYNFKIERIKKFLGEGHKAKVTMMFRGREIAYKEFAFKLMDKIADDVVEAGVIEARPKMEGRNMSMMVVPGKTA